jgi:hypothetical protein
MSLRLCSHIKTNGAKCASPALRHHTLCYFHYQWQRRDQRRIRLGGPVGMNKNSGIELPLLDGPEAILLSIMEIQHGLLDQRIPIKMGTALLYSLQLALQAKISYFGLCHSSPVRECPELDLELEMDRARGMRPAKNKCAACPKQDTCLSPRGCKKLPKLPPGYRRVDDHLVYDTPGSAQQNASSFRAESRSDVVEGPAFPPAGVTALQTSSDLNTATNSLRESSPGRELGETDRKFPPSRVYARRQIAHEERGTKNEEPTENGEQRTENPLPLNILRSNPNALIDLEGKFPQLAETKEGQTRGVGDNRSTVLSS